MAILFVFQSFDRHDFVSSLKKKMKKNTLLKRKKERKVPARQAGSMGQSCRQWGAAAAPSSLSPPPPTLEPRLCRVRKAAAGPRDAGPPRALRGLGHFWAHCTGSGVGQGPWLMLHNGQSCPGIPAPPGSRTGTRPAGQRRN